MAVGGPEVSYNSADVLKCTPEIDYVICGEGETPFRQLCGALITGRGMPIPGVAYRQGGRIVPAEPYAGKRHAGQSVYRRISVYAAWPNRLF